MFTFFSFLLRFSNQILLKATAGGGGIGMYECSNESELRSHFDGAQRAAKSFFSNSALFLEKYYARARHIEVQIFGDGFGEVCIRWIHHMIRIDGS